jgi:hypothetical protein
MELVTDPTAIAHLNATAQAGDAESVPGVNALDAGLSGTDLLEHLKQTDPVTAAGIEAMHEGRLPGTGRNLQKLMPLAALAAPPGDPFDAGVYQARQQARKSFTAGGKDWQNIQRYGTAINHATELMGTIPDLGNTSLAPGFVNPVSQFVKENIGNTKFQEAQARFARAKEALSSELGAAFRAQGLAEADVNRWEQGLHQADSPVALRSSVQEALRLLGGRMETTLSGWNNTFPNKPKTLDDILELAQPGMSQKYHSLLNVDAQTGKMGGGAAAAGPNAGGTPQGPAAQPDPLEGRTAINPQTGQRIMRRGGQWVPFNGQ